MTQIILAITLIAATQFSNTALAGGAKISCFTNYAGEILVTGKIRFSATRNGQSLNSIEMRYFNGRDYVPTQATINSNNNPDSSYAPRSYKGYLRYYLGAGGRGEGYELLLPEVLSSNFKGYISYYNLEGKTSLFELLCRTTQVDLK